MVGPGEPAGNKIENDQTLLGLTLQLMSRQTDSKGRRKMQALTIVLSGITKEPK